MTCFFMDRLKLCEPFILPKSAIYPVPADSSLADSVDLGEVHYVILPILRALPANYPQLRQKSRCLKYASGVRPFY